MKYTTLKTISRQPMGTRSNNRLRKEGAIPGSVLKLDKTSTSLSINRSDFVNLINTQGRSAVFKLAIDKQKPIFTMIRDIEVQSHTDIYLNVNLFEVSLKEEIKASVDFKIINDESLQLSKLRVSQYIKSLNVTGLPNDIPDYIEIDASNFKNGDNILLKDITLPDGIATDADPESLLISVSSFKAVPAQEDTETPDEEQAE